MAREKDPNELGLLWINMRDKGKKAGTLGLSGDYFEIPEGGITVDLIPFEFTSKTDGKKFRGLRVVLALPSA